MENNCRGNTMNLKDKFIKTFIYGGLEKEDFDRVQESLAYNNSRMLLLTALICMVLFLGMFLSTFFSAKTASMDELRMRSRMIYVFMILICGMTIIIRQQQKQYCNRFIIIEWYLFLSLLFGFAIWAGTFNQPYNPSITFFVFLFALPLLIIERPIRLFIYLIGVSMLFLVCSYQTKTTDIYELDFLNCLCFLYLSISFSMIMMIFKYNEAFQKIKIEEQRDRDELTGLLNKAAIEREVCKCLEQKEKGYLLMIDIDNFKYINDQYGHLVGDAVLSAYAKSFEAVFAQSSLIGRFGGDEFILFVKKEHFHDVLQLFEQGKQILKTMINIPIQDGMPLTMSAGAAFFHGNEYDYRRLLELADRALYEVKQEGKNQIKLMK